MCCIHLQKFKATLFNLLQKRQNMQIYNNYVCEIWQKTSRDLKMRLILTNDPSVCRVV